jgi:hypothetical protein
VCSSDLLRCLTASIALLLLLAGCTQPRLEESSVNEDALFGPATMRIHPIFTQVKDWSGDGRPDGVEALLEFNDQFGDPTKAAGSVMFELFAYRQGEPDPRGRRVVNPWFGSISTRREQEARWNPTSRTYSFQLAYPKIDSASTYVLTAVFRSVNGGRFFDRVVLEGQEAPVVPAPSATQPTTAPTTEPTTAPAIQPATQP